jgi:hypothetical protein
MRRNLHAMGRVGGWGIASLVENPGASARGCYAMSAISDTEINFCLYIT